jgi:hypothetical protein
MFLFYSITQQDGCVCSVYMHINITAKCNANDSHLLYSIFDWYLDFRLVPFYKVCAFVFFL